MFNKPSRPDAAPDPTPGRPRKVGTASLLGPDLVFEGRLSGQGEVHVEGRIVGDVLLGRLIVGETGSVEGAIEAEQVDVRGRVVGSIHAAKVRIAAGAHVEADITHQQLAMEMGAFFQGRCVQVAEGGVAPAPALLESRPAIRSVDPVAEVASA